MLLLDNDASKLESAQDHALLGSKLLRLHGEVVVRPQHGAPHGRCIGEHGPGLACLARRLEDDADPVLVARLLRIVVTKHLTVHAEHEP